MSKNVSAFFNNNNLLPKLKFKNENSNVKSFQHLITMLNSKIQLESQKKG